MNPEPPAGAKQPLSTHDQGSAYRSPWSLRRRIALLAWSVTWTLACRWTPKPLNFWRLAILRLFGASISGRPFVHARARIHLPWNLVMKDRACLGDRANAYAVDTIVIGEGATVAQEAYLCAGTHDLSDPALPLQTAPITLGKEVFVGARAFVMPGVTVGDEAVIGACAVVIGPVPAGTVFAGNPARRIGDRPRSGPRPGE